MTPRKFYALLNVALEYNEAKWGSDKKKKKQKVVDGYIDELNW